MDCLVHGVAKSWMRMSDFHIIFKDLVILTYILVNVLSKKSYSFLIHHKGIILKRIILNLRWLQFSDTSSIDSHGLFSFPLKLSILY